MLCLTISVVFAAIIAANWGVVVQQLRLVVPQWMPAADKRVFQEAPRRFAQEKQLQAIRQACRRLLEPASQTVEVPWEPSNGLFAHLRLLELLRQAETTGSELKWNEPMAAVLRAPRARLLLGREMEIQRQVRIDLGCSPRWAYVQSRLLDRARPLWAEYLSRIERLTKTGNDAESGTTTQPDTGGEVVALRGAATIRLNLCGLTLLNDLLEEYPALDMVQLANTQAAALWHNVAQGFQKQGASSAALASAAQERSQQWRQFAQQWSDFSRDRPVNVLPFTGEWEIAAPEHRRVLCALTAVVVLSASWMVLALMAMVLLVLSSVHTLTDLGMGWRINGWGRWLAVVMAGVPSAMMLAFVAFGQTRFDWLFSLPSLPLPIAVVLWTPLFCLVAAHFLAVGGHVVVSRWGAVAVMLGFAVPIIMALLWPTSLASWQPPVHLAIARRAAVFLIGTAGIAILAVAAGRLRRHPQNSVGRVLFARALLDVCARSLLVVTLLLAVALVWDARSDRAHETAFMRAIFNPMSDWVGPAWSHMLQEDRALLQSLQVVGQ